MSFNNYFDKEGWKIIDSETHKGREAIYYDYNDLSLSEYSINFLKRKAPKGIYKHQYYSIKKYLEGDNVCISTSTASGKTLVFNICAIEEIIKGKRVLAVYPLRALATEQDIRWKELISLSGLNLLDIKVGKIDGSVPYKNRINIMRQSHILIMTPDIMHSWLLTNVSHKKIYSALLNIGLIVIDECHTYTGVFGSNSAYLFRRIQHLMLYNNATYRYCAASATIKDSNEHLNKLTGSDFYVIDNYYNTSPKNTVKFFYVNPPSSDLFAAYSTLVKYILNNTVHNFITFVDSRKKTEYLTSIINREIHDNTSISPYRAGYEDNDRDIIQDKLTSGLLRGVISTSALEMGIDIPHLDLGILIGVPYSATSLFQRIGRIGRNKDGIIIIVNNYTTYTEKYFRKPKDILNMPLGVSSLYLYNKRIQYIHAMCMVSEEEKCGISYNNNELDTMVDFPETFKTVYEMEKTGELEPEFENMKICVSDSPSYTYPLRNIDTQYRVLLRTNIEEKSLGKLSSTQVLREAYPGAIYYYNTKPFRVTKIDNWEKLIYVRKEKKYYTNPIQLPALIYPKLTNNGIYDSINYGRLYITECRLQVRELISGYKESRGPNNINRKYPINGIDGVYYNESYYKNIIFTTGVIIYADYLSLYKNILQKLSEIIFESFLMAVPYERQDINYSVDKIRKKRDIYVVDKKFVSLYDQTYGSLRLTNRILENNIIRTVINNAKEIIFNDKDIFEYNKDKELAKELINIIMSDINNERKEYRSNDAEILYGEECEMIVKPGSKCIYIANEVNKIVKVIDVKYSPKQGMIYKCNYEDNTSIHYIPKIYTKEIPGITEYAYYDLNTTQIKEV